MVGMVGSQSVWDKIDTVGFEYQQLTIHFGAIIEMLLNKDTYNYYIN